MEEKTVTYLNIYRSWFWSKTWAELCGWKGAVSYGLGADISLLPCLLEGRLRYYSLVPMLLFSVSQVFPLGMRKDKLMSRKKSNQRYTTRDSLIFSHWLQITFSCCSCILTIQTDFVKAVKRSDRFVKFEILRPLIFVSREKQALVFLVSLITLVHIDFFDALIF